MWYMHDAFLLKVQSIDLLEGCICSCDGKTTTDHCHRSKRWLLYRARKWVKTNSLALSQISTTKYCSLQVRVTPPTNTDPWDLWCGLRCIDTWWELTCLWMEPMKNKVCSDGVLPLHIASKRSMGKWPMETINSSIYFDCNYKAQSPYKVFIKLKFKEKKTMLSFPLRA